MGRQSGIPLSIVLSKVRAWLKCKEDALVQYVNDSLLWRVINLKSPSRRAVLKEMAL